MVYNVKNNYFVIHNSKFIKEVINLDNSQLLKGILEGCILAIILQGETYGYDILIKLDENGLGDIGEGTLYPVLTRLEKKGFISCRIGKSPLGPSRKYFSITEEGTKELNEFCLLYKNITDIANNILGGV